jgi:cystathionine beta-lyase
MNYDFDTVTDRRGSGCFKYDALKSLYGREDLVSLWVADMDFVLAPPIREALQKRLDHGVMGYNFRLPHYYEAIQNWVKKRYGYEIEADWIVNSPGIVPAINIAVITLTQPGDRILVQTPVYRPFFNAVTDHDRCLLTNSLICRNGRYEIDFEDFERKLKQASLFILCSPHNPMGRLWTREELAMMGELAVKYQVPVISDEIHADIVYDGAQFVALASFEAVAENVITCISPAKSFNVAGLTTAAIIIRNSHLRKMLSDRIEKLHLYLGNSFGIEAVIAAYRDSEEWLEALLVYLDQNRRYLRDYIGRELPQLSMIQPESTYLAWLDFSKLELDDSALFEFLTNKARIALDPGRKFGIDGSGYSRLNFGCPRSLLVEAMERLKLALEDTRA